MTAGTAWMKAFPIEQANRAVEALLRGWREMASVERSHFSPKTKEPRLTRVVRSHVRRKVAPEMKLLGHWGTEAVENDVDPETGEILEEGRTDVEYTWNNETIQLVLVFEFKKLTAVNTSRKRYLEDGVMKFVTGVYSVGEPLAVMVGILMAPAEETISGLRRSIDLAPIGAAVRACSNGDGRFVHVPSILFPSYAAFDTEHLRDPEKAPAHGTIRIAHAFVEFPYATFPDKSRKQRAGRLTKIEDELDLE